MAGTFTNLQYHLVFSTKAWRPSISDAIRPRLYEYMGGIVRTAKGIVYEIGGMADHVHLLIRWRADKSVSDLLRDLKSNSSRWVHETFPNKKTFAWQDGYGAFTVSQSRSADVKAYIADQPRRHRKFDFKAEFIGLLQAHGVEYDERYIWK